MFVVDSQVHIWPANTPERPWPPGTKSHKKRASFSKDELLQEMETAGVDRAVLVPPSWQGDSNEFALEAARLHPDRFAVMGRIDPTRPDGVTVLSDLKQQSGMKGLRLTFSTGQSLATSEVAWLWPAAERAGMPLALAARSEMLQDVANIARKHPGIKLAIDHFAVVRNALDDAAFAELPRLLALEKLPNIVVKVSALPCLSSEAYPYKGLHKYVRQVYEASGRKGCSGVPIGPGCRAPIVKR
jgi:L-fuconolactonase